MTRFYPLFTIFVLWHETVLFEIPHFYYYVSFCVRVCTASQSKWVKWLKRCTNKVCEESIIQRGEYTIFILFFQKNPLAHSHRHTRKNISIFNRFFLGAFDMILYLLIFIFSFSLYFLIFIRLSLMNHSDASNQSCKQTFVRSFENTKF